MPFDSSHRLGRRAVVIGASMAGLAAARALHPHFDQVLLVDRDVLPPRPEHRLGVPQGRHGHGLLAGGLRALAMLFPGIEDDLVAGGAVKGDPVREVRWHQHGYDKLQVASGMTGLLMSRPLLESVVRAHVRKLPRVRIADRSAVAGLLLSADRSAVTGIRLQPAGLPDYPCRADLVVDASGRSSRLPEWLAEHEYPRPDEDTLEVGIGYTTRVYRRRPEDLDGDVGAIVAPLPPDQRRLGFMLALEGQRWIVGLGGWLGDHAPRDPEGYLAFARSLPRPCIHDVIARAEPLDDATTYAFPSNRRRRYERLSRFPERLIVMGDALCSFNPIYGQGMSVAALEAVALDDALTTTPTLDGAWRRFAPRAAAIVDGPWAIAAGGDLAFAGVRGKRSLATLVVNRYLHAVHRAAAIDPSVCLAFFEVANLLAPPSRLFGARVALRVARTAFRRGGHKRQERAPVTAPALADALDTPRAAQIR